MIYTITFNPSIDQIVEVDVFQLGKVNRTANEYILTGGKGINVSIVLNNLGIESQAFPQEGAPVEGGADQMLMQLAQMAAEALQSDILCLAI